MRKQIRNNALILCLGILLFASCWERQRVNVLTPKKLEAVLYDYHLAQVMTNDLGYSERYMKDLYFSYVLDKHGVTSAEIDSALVPSRRTLWLCRKPSLFSSMAMVRPT